jgi:hypothetical protein
MNRAFSAGGFALPPFWGPAPGCHERCAFGAKHIPGFHPVSHLQDADAAKKQKAANLAVHGLSREAKIFA